MKTSSSTLGSVITFTGKLLVHHRVWNYLLIMMIIIVFFGMSYAVAQDFT